MCVIRRRKKTANTLFTEKLGGSIVVVTAIETKPENQGLRKRRY